MTTPLQQAAQAVIDRWDSPAWKDRPHTAEYIEGLRKALDDEIAQSVEPVADDIVAGALYDFLGYLTSRRTRITMSDRDDAGAAADALVDWSKTRKINLAEARVVDWNDYTHPPQPQATTAVPSGERAELIAELRRGVEWNHFNEVMNGSRVEAAMGRAAGMLAADAREIDRLRSIAREAADAATELQRQVLVLKAQQVSVPQGWMLVPLKATPAMSEAGANGAREYYELFGGNSPSAIYEAMIRAAPQPPQADAPPQRQPMTDQEISELALQEQLLLFCDSLDELTCIVRAVENHHEIYAPK